MNDVYQEKNQRPRQQTRRTPPAKNRFFSLFLKQTSAAVICALLVWCMHTLPVPRFRQWMDALGRALRYESDLTDIKETGAYLINWISQKISSDDDSPALETPGRNSDSEQTAPPAVSEEIIPSGSSDEITEH